MKTILERSKRIENAIDWLEENALKSNFSEPWLSRARTLTSYYKESGIEVAENFILNGDNFLDAGWIDPFKLK